MKKLKTKTKLVIAIITLAMTFVLTIGYGFAWYILSDEANKLTLQITKIDSEIYLSQGVDSNGNGIPDLLSRYTDPSVYGYSSDVTKDEYYKENKAFKYIGMKNAISTDVETTENLTYDLGTIYPSQIKTLKFSIVNKSDADNHVSFAFVDKTDYTQNEINFLKCMSVRVGKITNNTLSGDDTTKYDLNSSDLSFSFSEKYYFMDKISETSFSKLSLLENIETYEVKGQLTKNENKNDHVLDLWFQLEFETYDVLKEHYDAKNTDSTSDFSSFLSNAQYQAVSGTKINFPDLQAILEIRLDS